jgi:hypothetical protein
LSQFLAVANRRPSSPGSLSSGYALQESSLIIGCDETPFMRGRGPLGDDNVTEMTLNSFHSFPRTALAVLAAAAVSAATALAAGSYARPATKSERTAIMASFTANDGSASEVRGVYVSRSNPNLAVVCARTPEAGPRAYVLSHVGRSWRYVTSGRPGTAGNSVDRRLERACG